MTEARTGVETESRAAAVRATRLLETGPEAAFDRLCSLAATILDAPMTYMTVVDDVRSFLKGAPDSAAISGPEGTFEVPAREAACQLVVDSGEEILVGDTAADMRLRDLVQIKAFGARSWIGVPILDPDGYVLGNLCAMDSQVREWTAGHLESMRTLAAAANDAIALRLAARDLQNYADHAAELAETLQQSLLPMHPPHVPGMTIATRCHQHPVRHLAAIVQDRIPRKLGHITIRFLHDQIGCSKVPVATLTAGKGRVQPSLGHPA